MLEILIALADLAFVVSLLVGVAAVLVALRSARRERQQEQRRAGGTPVLPRWQRWPERVNRG